MQETRIGTLVTYTISDDDARDALVGILKELGYGDGKDQSTMICEYRKPNPTIAAINNYCSSNEHDFMTGDILVIHSPVETTVEGERRLRILRREYRFSMSRNAFI